MIARMLTALMLVLAWALPAQAERELLGYGRLLNNDSVLGDWKDRWQTGNVVASRVWGPAWTGSLPDQPGQLIELRLNFQVIAPTQLSTLNPADRPYVGVFTIGAHTHFDWHGFETAAGVDMVVTGPQTGLIDFQDSFHTVIGFNNIADVVKDSQIGNGVHPTGVVELARAMEQGGARLRPFTEFRAGAETLLRAGVDVTFGDVGRGELLVRDPVTGQRYRTIWNPDYRGQSFVVGADVAYVDNSVFLPGNGTYALEQTRTRIRAGYHWHNDDVSGFYGVTWLSPEFTTQNEGQFVGSIRLRTRF